MSSRWKKFRSVFKTQNKFLDQALDTQTPTTTDLVSLELGDTRLALDPVTKKWRVTSGGVPVKTGTTAVGEESANTRGTPGGGFASLVKGLSQSQKAKNAGTTDSPKVEGRKRSSTVSTDRVSPSTNQELRQKIQRLQEENNMLKYKQEILLNMLSVKELDRANYEIIFQKLGIRPERLKKRKD